MAQQCDRFFRGTRRGSLYGRCQHDAEEIENKNQEFCLDHKKFCRRANKTYKELETYLADYMEKHCIRKNYFRHGDYSPRQEHLWGFTKTMIKHLTKTVKSIVRVRKAYSSLCTGGYGSDDGHSRWVSNMTNLLRTIQARGTINVPPDLGLATTKRERKRRIVKKILREEDRQANPVLRTRNIDEYNALKTHYERLMKLKGLQDSAFVKRRRQEDERTGFNGQSDSDHGDVNNIIEPANVQEDQNAGRSSSSSWGQNQDNWS